MSSPLIFVRDGRTMPYVPVSTAALEALRATCAQPRKGGERRSYPHALAVYIALLEFANAERGSRVALSQTDLGNRAGMSRRTVQRVLDDVQVAGVVEVNERIHGMMRTESEYVVIEPPENESATLRHNGAAQRQTVARDASERRNNAGARPSPPLEAQARDREERDDGDVESALRANGNDAARGDVVKELFDFWKQRCGHPQAKMTRERTAKIEARLKDGYTPKQIATAIAGAQRGAYVSDTGKRFDDIELICRNGTKLESFIDRATAAPNHASRPSSGIDRLLAMADELEAGL